MDELPAHLQAAAALLQVGPTPGAPRPEDPWREQKWKVRWWKEQGHDEEEAYERRDAWVREKLAEWNKDRGESGDQYRKMPPWEAEHCGIDLEAIRRGWRPGSPSLQNANPPAPLPKGERRESAPAPHPRGEEFIKRLDFVGGVDFGFRNPFAAVWGFVDPAGVLWLVGEHYQRQRPLSHHVRYLPREVTWYADPAGANEMAEMRREDFVVRRGINSLRPGIGAVAARIESGRLKILAGRCPQLLAEAELYRYGEGGGDRRAEQPVDESNHALAALRYLVSRLDNRHFELDAGTEAKPAAPLDDEDGWGWRRIA